MRNKGLMNQYAGLLPGYTFTSYGAGMEDHIMKTAELAKRIQDSGWTWHYKPEGDGYGHVIHNTFAVGRPALVWAPFYGGKLASDLFIDKKTCLNLAARSVHENVNLVHHYSQPDEHARMCENTHRRFAEVVDFDQEEQRIRQFLENLR
jgi:hypothetical protein